MSGATALDIACWILGGVFGLAGLWALVAFARGDRSRGRKRCPKCWYDMATTVGLRCPECGREAKDERGFLRTRRPKRRFAAALVLLIVSGVSILSPRIWREGWLSVVPMSVKIAALPFGGDTLRVHLEERLGVGAMLNSKIVQIDDEQLVGVVDRIRHGLPFVRPGGSAWERSYGVLWDRLRAVSGVVSAKPNELRLGNRGYGPMVIEAYERMLELPIGVKVEMRSVSVAGLPIPFRAVVTHRWPRWMLDDSELVWVEPTGERKAGFRSYSTIEPAGFDKPGELMLDATIVTFAYSARNASRREIDTRPTNLRTRLVERVEDAMTPVRSEALDVLLKSSVKFDRNMDGAIWPGTALDSAYDDCAFAMLVEIYEGDTLLVRGYSHWFGLRGALWKDAAWGPITFHRPQAEVDRAMRDPSVVLTVKVQSDPKNALEVIDATRYWEGAFTFTSP
jgi:hypothetical protein